MKPHAKWSKHQRLRAVLAPQTTNIQCFGCGFTRTYDINVECECFTTTIRENFKRDGICESKRSVLVGETLEVWWGILVQSTSRPTSWACSDILFSTPSMSISLTTAAPTVFQEPFCVIFFVFFFAQMVLLSIIFKHTVTVHWCPWLRMPLQ